MKQNTEQNFNYKTKESKRKNIEALLGLLKLKRGDTLSSNKKVRTHKNDFQRAVLNEVFSITKFPTSETREDLALVLNHTTRGIQIWFQNNRHNSLLSSSKGDKSSDEPADGKNVGPIVDPFRNKKKSLDRLTLCDILGRHCNGKRKHVWNEFIEYLQFDSE